MEKEQALQALLDQVVRQGDFIGVSALYLRDGKQLAYAQAGMADRERGIPFARDTICRVFSMSKPITAFAVMKLWEDGKLDLDAPVAAYLPEFGDAEHTNLTIRQLLCMTSGYGYNDNDSVQSAGLGRLYAVAAGDFSLHLAVHLLSDDALVIVFNVVLWQLAGVFLRTAGQHIVGKGLLQQDITAVFLILQDA